MAQIDADEKVTGDFRVSMVASSCRLIRYYFNIEITDKWVMHDQ